jgi:hypothetical protein
VLRAAVQGRMTWLTWKDKQSGATHYGAEIVAMTLDYQGANDEDEVQVEQVAVEAPTPQPAEPVAVAEEIAPAKPKRSRSKKAQAAAASERIAWGWGMLPRPHFLCSRPRCGGLQPMCMALWYDSVYNTTGSY